ncbi:hypothetical protein BXT86_02200 [candidate division WOR-3 bacterium 4484_100]|uniref:GIY-YIG domain-containing protein n=1 Tax=candidate division WOR-3 bacterium 4484_100 TaxID=1936077 RepID=A0A1V4QGX1_UNCW3|nr:MAG: hypothetical protein BXT86_02200 [candidate division WOR-3 bacterium 4484_100]
MNVITPITYLLKIYLAKTRIIKIGALGRFKFKRGYYIYVGSARKNLGSRVERHLRKKMKKRFWHIDYLLEYGRVTDVLLTHIPEEKVAQTLTKWLDIPAPGFGASDKNSRAHLFKLKGKNLPELPFSLTPFKKRVIYS